MADASCRYVKFVIDRSLERKQRKHEIYGALNFMNPVLPVSPDTGTDIMDGGDVIRPEGFFYPQIEVRRINANKNRRGMSPEIGFKLPLDVQQFGQPTQWLDKSHD